MERSRSGFSSNFKYLVQQVEEQSPFCDFTVQVGHWTKRYHKCVLVTCPFFERAVTGNFIEKQKGLVNVGVGTPYSVDTAIMYLYDVVPYIQLHHVERLLEQAEYFMITGLKSTCISWIRQLKITDSNCMILFKLSSVYNFEIPACMAYVESHLPEVYRTQEALNFSNELVKDLFTDKRLSYVTMDDKLLFLSRWVCRNTRETKANVVGLFETININDVTESVWQQVSNNSLLNEKVDFDKVIRCLQECEYKCDVLIMTDTTKKSIMCLNLLNDTWFQLKVTLPEDSYDILRRISGIRNTKPEVYFTIDCDRIMTLNLETNETNDYNFILEDEDISKETITNVCLADNILLVLTRKRVQIIKTDARRQMENTNVHNHPGPSTSTSESPTGGVGVLVVCENGRTFPPQFIEVDFPGSPTSSVYSESPRSVHIQAGGENEILIP